MPATSSGNAKSNAARAAPAKTNKKQPSDKGCNPQGPRSGGAPPSAQRIRNKPLMPPTPKRQRSKPLPPAARREVEDYTRWLAHPSSSKQQWTFGTTEQLMLAASQGCVGCLLFDNTRDGPEVAALASEVRAHQGYVFRTPTEALKEVCGLAARLRRPISLEEEQAWERAAEEAAVIAPTVARSLSKVVGPLSQAHLQAASAAEDDATIPRGELSEEARDELTCLEAMFSVDGHYRRLSSTSFQLLADDEEGAGYLVLEIALPSEYPSTPPTLRIHGSSRVGGASLSRSLRAAATEALDTCMQRHEGEPLLFELHNAARVWMSSAVDLKNTE